MCVHDNFVCAYYYFECILNNFVRVHDYSVWVHDCAKQRSKYGRKHKIFEFLKKKKDNDLDISSSVTSL